MRLICPNCEAQYEVPDDVIPTAGRDVQCSNCATTWFFRPVDPADEEARLDAVAADAAPQVQEAPAPRRRQYQPADVPQPAAAGHDQSPPAPSAPHTERRRLDPEVADVLREEAEFEARARAAERATLETQSDLGLDDLEAHDEDARRAAEVRRRMERMRNPVPSHEPQVASAAAAAGAVAAAEAAENTRRGLLPDVEEINSTLRSGEDRRAPQTAEIAYRDIPEPRRRGFWFGLLVILFLAALAIAAYVLAPQIKAQLPQASAPLDTYVETVDQGRAWLDDKVLQGLAWLDSLASQAGDAPSSEATPVETDMESDAAPAEPEAQETDSNSN